mgnify:CR=1 FL=1
MSARRLDAHALLDWAHTAVAELVAHADEINRLNVFPVPDSDTGTNLLFTMRTAAAAADARGAAGGPAAVAAALAAGATDGARGNSGVILSQILRALAEVTAAAGERPEIDAAAFAAVLRRAVDFVVEAMGGVVPGTIVSVLQAAAEASGGAVEKAADRDVAEVCAGAAEAAAEALAHTPEQLEVLAAAGVVDAGGRGLLVLLDALTATLTGRAPHRDPYLPAPGGAEPAPAAGVPPQFEVMYLVAGCAAADAEALRTRLEQLGDSVIVAAAACGGHSVHVHCDDAGAAVEAGLAVGTLSRIQITALTGGPGARGAAWSRDRAVVAVVEGDGAADLFGGEGAQVLRADADGPVTAQRLLHALVDTGAAQIMVLPNGYVAAEELVAGCTAAIGWGIDVVPVPAASMVQGLAALAVHDPARQAVDDGYTMARAAAGCRHGSVRVATERALTWAGPCRPGDGLGISAGEVLVVGPDIVTAGTRLIDLLLAAGGELVTVLLGADAGAGAADALREHVQRNHLGIEIGTYHTGHHGDPLLIGVE